MYVQVIIQICGRTYIATIGYKICLLKNTHNTQSPKNMLGETCETLHYRACQGEHGESCYYQEDVP